MKGEKKLLEALQKLNKARGRYSEDPEEQPDFTFDEFYVGGVFDTAALFAASKDPAARESIMRDISERVRDESLAEELKGPFNDILAYFQRAEIVDEELGYLKKEIARRVDGLDLGISAEESEDIASKLLKDYVTEERFDEQRKEEREKIDSLERENRQNKRAIKSLESGVEKAGSQAETLDKKVHEVSKAAEKASEDAKEAYKLAAERKPEDQSREIQEIGEGLKIIHPRLSKVEKDIETACSEIIEIRKESAEKPGKKDLEAYAKTEYVEEVAEKLRQEITESMPEIDQTEIRKVVDHYSTTLKEYVENSNLVDKETLGKALSRKATNDRVDALEKLIKENIPKKTQEEIVEQALQSSSLGSYAEKEYVDKAVESLREELKGIDEERISEIAETYARNFLKDLEGVRSDMGYFAGRVADIEKKTEEHGRKIDKVERDYTKARQNADESLALAHEAVKKAEDIDDKAGRQFQYIAEKMNEEREAIDSNSTRTGENAEIIEEHADQLTAHEERIAYLEKKEEQPEDRYVTREEAEGIARTSYENGKAEAEQPLRVMQEMMENYNGLVQDLVGRLSEENKPIGPVIIEDIGNTKNTTRGNGKNIVEAPYGI